MRIKKRVSLIILIIAVLALLGSAPLFASADSGGQKSCTVTLDLDGGSVNGLIAQGWTASDTGASVWTRKEAAGTEITLETPYRAGYEFKAWRTDPEGVVTPGENGEYRIDTSQSETVTVTAVWEEALYDVIFADAVSSDEASVWWEIRMPYGAVLWTEAEETWMDIANDAWKESEGNENEWTAEVLFEGNEKIEVTRHGQNTEANPGYEEYYYTFRRDGVFYFTYGGKEPVREGYTFLRWSASGGESEYQILSDVCFTAQYTAGKTYVFTTYYYNENGSRVEGLTTQTQTVKESEVTDGKVVLDIEVPRVSHYTGELRRSGYAERGVIISEDPVSDENGTEHYSVTVEIAKAFENEGSYHLAFYTDYCPAQISYTVNYYQQKVGTGTDPGKDYDFVGAVSGTAAYESVVGIEDVPDRLIKNGAETDVSFEGFLVSSASQSSIRRGVELNNSVVDEADNTAEINIYYDRASYFIYPMTNSVEITLDPIKVQYGALIPRAEDAANISRAGYTLEGWDWYMLDESGALVEYSDVVMDQSTMPAHDLYPLANWKPETASLTIQYWVEDKNSSTYLNEFSYTVENIPTESNVTFSFTDHTLSAAGDPALTDQIKSAVEDGFKAHAGENEAQYFSYNEARTRQSLGNIQNAQESGTGDVSSDGTYISGESFDTTVKGNGSSVINVYYSRNLYTLQFVLGRTNKEEGLTYVATQTTGGIEKAAWNKLEQNAQIVFRDFGDDIEAREPSENEMIFGDSYVMNVSRIYQIKEAEARDTRAATGRYGTWESGKFIYQVYTLTARYGADISALWPTMANIAKDVNQNADKLYVSMGSHPDSVYSQKSNPNILNAYSTMDSEIISYRSEKRDPSAVDDNEGKGTVTHQLLAYWYGNNIYTYQYYFLYEVLDTSITPETPGVEKFLVNNVSEYKEGDLVSYNGRVYVYTENYEEQRSTNTKGGQNQPARQGYVPAGKVYEGNESDQADAPIYFFYSRETYELTIYSENGNYIPDEAADDFLSHKFDELTYLGDGGKTVTADNVSLQELGWESINKENYTFGLRYGASLSVLNDSDVINYMTEHGLKHSESMGENDWYFSRWYMNQGETVEVNWSSNDVQGIEGNRTFYVGWFTPRYSTAYVLNGGSWNEEQNPVDMTVMRADIPGSSESGSEKTTVILFYDHMTGDADSKLYWYQQVREDRLYVEELYETELSTLMEQSADGHWHLKPDMTIDRMTENSDSVGARENILPGKYLCYMQYTDGNSDESSSHRYYVSIIKAEASVLEEPSNPVRNGYQFGGWWHFDGINETAPPSEKVYLEDVLSDTESLSSYGDGYVYLNSVGDAFLLHRDSGGLYYYPAQTGYRFNYNHDAAIVDKDRSLYAAWTATGDTSAKIMHLVEKNQADGNISFTDPDHIAISLSRTITINGTEYYILEEETAENLYTGSSHQFQSKAYYKENNGTIWLPETAGVDVNISDRTETAGVETDGSITYENGGNIYRLKNENAGGYAYYAWIVYRSTDSVQYTIYAIDIGTAVGNGVLEDYGDRLDRADPPDAAAPYVLGAPVTVTVSKEELTNGIVRVTAPEISGYTVYDEWEQEFQLDAGNTNNIYFYYIGSDDRITYSITYYLMDNGRYRPENTIALSGVPGARGESVRLTDMIAAYQSYVQTAYRVHESSSGSSTALKEMYERYKNMKIDVSADGVDAAFQVDKEIESTLSQETAASMTADYRAESWSPSGESLILTEGTHIDVYLMDARVILNKMDASGKALQGAEFQMERLIPGSGDAGSNTEIVIDGKQYCVDPTFGTRMVTSDQSGQAVFNDLSADLEKGYIYRITETKAPLGQMQLSDPFFVTVPYIISDGDGTDGSVYYTVTYDITNPGITYLPKAGINGGIYIPLLLGGGLISGAVILYSQQGRKKINRKKGE